MSTKIIDKNWKISDDPLEIRTALKDIYDDLVNSLKLFPNNYSLFTAGLVYGLLHNKRHDVKPTAAFIKLFAITDSTAKDVIDLIYYVLDDGQKEKSEIWSDMLYLADGGVLELNDIYKSNKNFRIPYILHESEELWKDRIKILHNINLKNHNSPN